MRRLLRWVKRALLLLAVLAAGLWIFGSREPVDATVAFDTDLGADMLDAYFAAAEARFPDITPGTEKRVVWAGAAGARTAVSVLYLHGFSATSEEIRPVPDRVAAALGANLVFTRLAGHGRDGAALAQATAGDWIEDLAEALAAARAVGDRVLVIATSTGGTLAALAATDPALSAQIRGIAFVSPNFGLAKSAARILTWPAARWWVPIFAGAERSFAAMNQAHATFWTSRYPTVAALPMAALVKYTLAQDFAAAKVPALFLYSPADAVVSAAATEAAAARWGGKATLAPQTVPPGNDPYNHVLAGDILSPGMTDSVVEQILDWAAGL